MSSRKPIIIATISIVVNVLVWLPGCYLSFVAWFTKFSGNTPFETILARSAGITPILGIILSVLSIMAFKSDRDYTNTINAMRFSFAGAVCAAPLLVYIALKLF